MKLARLFGKSKAYIIPRMVLVLAGLIFVAVAFLLVELLSIDKLFPSADKRHDIRELYIAPLKDICGDASVTPARLSTYESCVRDLSSSSLREGFSLIPVPTLEDIFAKSRPSFESLLNDASPSAKARIFGGREPFIMGFLVPVEFFSERVHTSDHYKLVHGYMRDAIICLNERCDFVTTLTDQGVMTVPMHLPDSHQVATTHYPIWIFGNHVARAQVMSLQNGIFVTKDSELWKAKRFYPLNMNAGMLAFSMSLCSIFVVLFYTSSIWKSYNDHVYLLFLGVNFSALAIYDRIMAPQVLLSYPFYAAAGHIVIWSFVLSSMVTFSFSTLRYNPRTTFRFLLGTLAASSMTGFALLLANASAYEKARKSFDNIFHFVMATGPTLLCLAGAVICFRLRKDAVQRYGYTSSHLSYSKRFRQQLVFTACVFAFNWPSLQNFIAYLRSDRLEEITNFVVIVSYLAIFINIVRPSVMRLKRAMAMRDRVSEAGILKLLLNQSAYERWKSQPRCGYVIEADLRGSTQAIPELKQGLHTIMKVLKQMILNDLARHDFVVEIMKPMGDAWIFIVKPPQAGMNPDTFASFVQMFAANLARYEAVLKTCEETLTAGEFARRSEPIGLNLRIFAIEEFFLRQTINKKLYQVVRELGIKHGTKLDISREDDSDLDFVGQDAHMMLKYLPKPPEAGISVGCSRSLIHSSLEDAAKTAVTLESFLTKSASRDGKTFPSKWTNYVAFTVVAEIAPEDKADSAQLEDHTYKTSA